MPNRILKESICVSDSINALSPFEETVFYRLIVNCDDYGRFDGRISVIKNRLYPLKDDLTLATVKSAIQKLVSEGMVVTYECMGKPYLYLPTWTTHQSVRAKRSKYPAPDGVAKSSTNDYEQTNTPDNTYEHMKSSENICKQMNADVPVFDIRNSESESNSICVNAPARESKQRPKPTLEQVEEYAKLRGHPEFAKRFFDYYDAAGWRDSQNTPVYNWQQKFQAWEMREQEKTAKKPTQGGKDWNEIAARVAERSKL